MNVLVLKLDNPIISYRLSKIPQKQLVRGKKRKTIAFGLEPLVSSKFDHRQNSNLSTYFESLYKELLNACFSFEIGHSKLKLQAFKVS